MSLINNLHKLETLALPTDQFAIISSGVLEIKGIRTARDLDILVSRKLWRQLCRRFAVRTDRGFSAILIDDIEIFGPADLFTSKEFMSAKEIMYTAEIHMGYRCMNMQVLKQFKQYMGREKDMRDLLLIEHYLAQIPRHHLSN